MKTIYLITIALLVTVSGFARKFDEGSTYKRFYREYRGTDNVITFKIPGGLASIFIDKEEKEVKEFMKKMDDISFFIATDQTNKMILDLNNSLPESVYKDIMVIKDGETEITFLARSGDNFITEIIMAVYEPDNLVVMCISGEFTKEGAKNIAKSINTENAINFRN